jgi:hypothetical protein
LVDLRPALAPASQGVGSAGPGSALGQPRARATGETHAAGEPGGWPARRYDPRRTARATARRLWARGSASGCLRARARRRAPWIGGAGQAPGARAWRRRQTVARVRGLGRRQRARACRRSPGRVSSSSSHLTGSTKARIAPSTATASRARVGNVRDANMCSYARRPGGRIGSERHRRPERSAETASRAGRGTAGAATLLARCAPRRRRVGCSARRRERAPVRRAPTGLSLNGC